MKIQVTQKHINEGSRGNCVRDPVALALLDAGYFNPWVGVHSIRFADKEFGFRHEFPIPKEVSDFCVRFDESQTVEPFEFEMEDV